jgi:hypothetical protein
MKKLIYELKTVHAHRQTGLTMDNGLQEAFWADYSRIRVKKTDLNESSNVK